MTGAPGLPPSRLPPPAAPQPPGRVVLGRPLTGTGPNQAFRLLPAGAIALGFEARVVATGASGGLLVHTPRGPYLLEGGPVLEAGARVRLVPTSTASRAIAPEPRSGDQPERAFPVLPSARVDGSLAASLVRLLAPGDPPGRPPTKATEPGSGEPQPGARPLPDGWRMLPLLLTGTDDEALVRIFHRLDDRPARSDDREDPAAAAAGRILLEIAWSRLGKTQIDLLVHERRADVRIRSRLELPAEVKAAIRKGFAAAIAVGRLTGTLGFISPELAPLPADACPLRPTEV